MYYIFNVYNFFYIFIILFNFIKNNQCAIANRKEQIERDDYIMEIVYDRLYIPTNQKTSFQK